MRPSRTGAPRRLRRRGCFREEIVPVEIPSAKKGAPATIFSADEAIRPETTVEILARLKPAFKEGGTVTAGNAPGVSDGAAALVVMSAERARELGLKPMAVIRAQATSGPRAGVVWPGAHRGGAQGGRHGRDGCSTTVDLFELNEAFSVQALAVIRDLGLDPAKVNVHGGAVALGHPIGASGARVLVTLLYAMQRYGKTQGNCGALPRRWQCGGSGGRTGLGHRPTGLLPPVELSDIEQSARATGQFQAQILGRLSQLSSLFGSTGAQPPLARQVLLPGVMDIARPDIKQKKKRQMFVWAGVAVVVLAVAVVVVSRLKPAAPPVDRSTIWPDTVKRGTMIRQVRGSTGTLGSARRLDRADSGADRRDGGAHPRVAGRQGRLRTRS